MKDWSLTSHGVRQTRQLGNWTGRFAEAGLVILLNGDLGSGKTCFAQGFAAGVGVPEDNPVTSPSYALMHVYQGRLPLFHFDLYRLSRVEDLDDLGYDEHAGGDGVTLVEWADRIAEPPDASLVVTLEHVAGASEQRRVRIEALDQQGESLLDRLQASWPVETNPQETP